MNSGHLFYRPVMRRDLPRLAAQHFDLELCIIKLVQTYSILMSIFGTLEMLSTYIFYVVRKPFSGGLSMSSRGDFSRRICVTEK